MRSLLLGCAIGASLLIGSANAQRAQEIFATDTIELRAGQARTFSFDQPVARVSLSTEGVAQVTPETDRVLNVRGLNPGEVLMTAYGPDGKVVHRSNISVGQTQNLVKLYGMSNGDNTVKDFIGYLCTDTGCGRADPDKAPLPISTSETPNKGDGSSVSTSRENR